MKKVKQNHKGISRRDFLKMAGMSGAGLALAGKISLTGASVAAAPKPPLAQTQVPGNKIPQFVDPLPLLSVGGGSIETLVAGAGEITLNMLEFQANAMPSTFVPANGLPYTGTWVFGYRVGPTAAPASAVNTNVGPVIVAIRGVPAQIRYVNNLTANNIHWRDWIDQSLHWANPTVPQEPMMTGMVGNPNKYMGPVPAVPHLHGGEVPAVIDGGPEAWYLSDEAIPGTWTAHGPAYYTKAGAAPNEAIYRYPNTQEAAPAWFHDHLLGATRINATFAGLAGAYPIIDPSLTLPAGLHPVGLQRGSTTDFLVPLVIQDRMFDTNGQLFFPNIGVNPEHPYWVPEFVGDTIIVNGKVWPYLNVDQQRYRFFLINGSNSRPYDMFLETQKTGIMGPPMWVIATDGGYLDTQVKIDPNATAQQIKAGALTSLMMMPGERYEIIVDFADPAWLAMLAKNRVTFPLNMVLRNVAPTVMGKPKPGTEGTIMQFRVSANVMPADTSYNPASGIPIRTGAQTIKRLVNTTSGALAAGVTADKTREFTLNEIAGPGGPLEALVNNSKWNGKRGDGSSIPGAALNLGLWLTEMPNEGDTEVWEIVNLTADAHPIHLHGVQFQILNRQVFNIKAFMAAYDMAFPGSTGIINPMTDLPYAPGAFIPGFGPPLDYAPSAASGGKYGGNPDVTPYLLGLARPQLPFEAGWKDTAIMQSGEVTRIAVRFAPQDKNINAGDEYFPYKPNALDGAYVWHCHITDHEDSEMMRPDQFQPNPTAVRTYIQGIDY